jgi:hypothetical protein
MQDTQLLAIEQELQPAIVQAVQIPRLFGKYALERQL